MTATFNVTKPAHHAAVLHAFSQSHGWALNAWARMAHAVFDNPVTRAAMPGMAGHVAGMAALADRMTRDYRKPAFGIPGLREEIVAARPFCDLVRFVPDGSGKDAHGRDIPANDSGRRPRVLLVAPMSGHHATLLRETVAGLARDHDVFITDWVCASRVPLSAGAFTLDSYISYVQGFIRRFHGDVHVMAVCQPGPAVLAAVSLMEAARDPAVPKSMVFLGAPIDTRINPTAVNALATARGTAWFGDNVLAHVPPGQAGAGRAIYPGILQLTGFMAMNADRHRQAHMDLFNAAAKGDADAVRKHDVFYDEYKAVMDLDAAFYMQTIDKVFVNHHLPKGQLVHTDENGRRQPVVPAAISRVALMTVEGERDDITGQGQTAAAHDLCISIPNAMRAHYLQPRAGHYGIFSGSRWAAGVLPQVTGFMRAHDGQVHARAAIPRAVPAGAG